MERDSTQRMTHHRRPAAGEALRSAFQARNEIGTNELPTMPKSRPTTGPMRNQPNEHASIVPVQVQPARPTQVKRAPEPKQKPTRTEAAHAAQATMTRRASLRKQREALRDKSRFGD
jgi:hypothetical protein